MRWAPALAILLLVTVVGNRAPSMGVDEAPLFPTEQPAQRYTYHFKGQCWYGRTKSGAFVCKQEADWAGDCGSLNGQ